MNDLSEVKSNEVDESSGSGTNVDQMDQKSNVKLKKRVTVRNMKSCILNRRSSVEKLKNLSIGELCQIIDDLEKENAELKSNISQLYKKSREEIKKKNDIIASLQESELDLSFSSFKV